MPFNNPIIGSEGTLVRDWMQSLNFVTGVSGWRISQNGDAEFNGVTLRSSLFVEGTDGSYVLIRTGGVHADIWLRPSNQGGQTWNPGRITADIGDYTGLFPDNPALSLQSPWEQDSSLTSTPAILEILGPSSLADDNAITAYTNGFFIDGPFFSADATASGSYPYNGLALWTGYTLIADSHWYDVVTIVPVAGVPTSVTVTGLTVEGSNFYGFVTPESAAPGDGAGNTVRMFSINGVSGTGATIWIYRGGVTPTNMYYQVIGQ